VSAGAVDAASSGEEQERGEGEMTRFRVVCAISLLMVGVGRAGSQDAAMAQAVPSEPAPVQQTVPLIVPKGMPLQVALDQEVRVRQAGQPIHGRVMQPVYAFDRLVIPAGSEVTGKIASIEGVSGKKRTLAALDAEFTPAHKIDVEFDELVLADGKYIPLHAIVSPGPGQVVQLVTAADNEKKSGVKTAATEKMKEAKQEARRQWEDAMKQVKEPGKVHRLQRYLVAQLPAHPQYIEAGTLYLAELEEPLDFGSEPLSTSTAASIGAPPPPGSLVRALLVTPLNSATTQKGEDVEAVLSQPLFDGEHLVLPQGSRLKGSVLQVQPAHHPNRNGELRIVFHELIPPQGVAEKVDASLEGVLADQRDHVQLDTEGGARTTTPKTRYLSTGITIALAAASTGSSDSENGVTSAGGDASGRAAGGAAGFKLIGIALGAAVHSQPLGMAMGAYGASRSVYTHFLARGRDVVFPKNTAMEIGFGARTAASQPQAKPAEGNVKNEL
jgi:type IV secretory pathway VirB10-like protein